LKKLSGVSFVPPIAAMTSPACSPAFAAGESLRTEAILKFTSHLRLR
jgi:hypothetical protein